MELCEALIQEKEKGKQRAEAVAFLQLSVYSPSGTSLLEGQKICSMLHKKLVLRQRVPLYLCDCTWCCLFLVLSIAQGHYSSKPISPA